MRLRVCMLIVLWIIACINLGFTQNPDATVIVHQSTLNGFLDAIGPVSGKANYKVAGAKGTYDWSVKNARITIAPGQAKMNADASIKVGPLKYNSQAKGDVDVRYNPEKNLISVKVKKASFEVYTKIFGKKIHIADVDISRFYRPEFEFAGPQPVQDSVEVEMPDGSKKTIYIKTKDHNMTLRENEIVVTSNLEFSEQP